jgi:hypothetical protein
LQWKRGLKGALTLKEVEITGRKTELMGSGSGGICWVVAEEAVEEQEGVALLQRRGRLRRRGRRPKKQTCWRNKSLQQSAVQQEQQQQQQGQQPVVQAKMEKGTRLLCLLDFFISRTDLTAAAAAVAVVDSCRLFCFTQILLEVKVAVEAAAAAAVTATTTKGK